MRPMAPAVILPSMLVLLAACGGQPKRSDPYLGNLNDHSYANRRGKTYPTAAGDALRFAELEGRFVWVDFAAPWCPPCAPQAGIIRQLEHSTPGVVFVTLMTSDHDPRTQATVATARSWAGRFGLDPARVAICGETRVIPSHMLFSPEGQLLYWSEGMHSIAQIQSVLSREVTGWRAAGL